MITMKIVATNEDVVCARDRRQVAENLRLLGRGESSALGVRFEEHGLDAGVEDVRLLLPVFVHVERAHVVLGVWRTSVRTTETYWKLAQSRIEYRGGSNIPS